MTSLTAKLLKTKYITDEKTVEALAHEHHVGDSTATRVECTYLRIVVAAAQAKLKPTTRGRRSSKGQLALIESVHQRFYPAVLRGITTPDVAPTDTAEPEERRRRTRERNSRSAYARTSVATLRKYVRAGKDLRGVDVLTVTKNGLRIAVAPSEPADKVERQILRAQDALARALTRRAKVDPDAARSAADAALLALRATIKALPVAEPEAEPIPTRRRSHVPEPAMLNRAA